MKQNGASVIDCYTSTRGIQIEIDTVPNLSGITMVAAHITTFVTTLAKQQEKMKLFQLLNGLDEKCKAQRSQTLIQREKLQKEVLEDTKQAQFESSAMLSSRRDERCGACGKQGHAKERLLAFLKLTMYLLIYLMKDKKGSD